MNAFTVRTANDRAEVVGPRGEVVRTWPYVRGDRPVGNWTAVVATVRLLAATLSHGTAVERERALREAEAST